MTILLNLSVTRGVVVRVYAITIIVAICKWSRLQFKNDRITLWTDGSVGLVTLMLLSATVATVILGRVVAKEILAIPVATLFAFTSLRGTLPGAPSGFGKRQAPNL